MLTNKISIVDEAPTLSPDSILTILNRILEIHSGLNKDGAYQYLCDLLNVNNLESITATFLTFEEVEPAVSSEELHVLANRVLSYNNNDIDKAIFSVRNILNTVPKSADDLIDYTTRKRKNEFIDMFFGKAIAVIGKERSEIKTIDDLSNLLSSEMKVVIDMICNEEMDRFQSIPLEQNGCITDRQNMLTMAGNYYLNHKVGFTCNSGWLAYFLSPQTFGCSAGWTHSDGTHCLQKHFGFKDTESFIKLLIQSEDYISSILETADIEFQEGDESSTLKAARMYLQALLFATDKSISLINQNEKMDLKKEKNIGDEFIKFAKDKNYFEDYFELMTDTQRLMYYSLDASMDEALGFTPAQFHFFKKVMQKSHENSIAPEEFDYWLYDAWNFFAFEMHNDNDLTLGPLVIKARNHPDSLLETAEIIKGYLLEDLENFHRDMFEGFFTSFLWVLINQNSDTHYLYNEILRICIDMKKDVKVDHNIRLMAELGHIGSIKEIQKDKELSERELRYWKRRTSLLS